MQRIQFFDKECVTASQKPTKALDYYEARERILEFELYMVQYGCRRVYQGGFSTNYQFYVPKNLYLQTILESIHLFFSHTMITFTVGIKTPMGTEVNLEYSGRCDVCRAKAIYGQLLHANNHHKGFELLALPLHKFSIYFNCESL
jgi:hypothetical protein